MAYQQSCHQKWTQQAYNHLPGLSLMERLSMEMMWKAHKMS